MSIFGASFAFAKGQSHSIVHNQFATSAKPVIKTSDTRISGTPVYQGGSISFALESALSNTTQNVPGIFFGLAQPTISYGGDRAASFPALMQKKTGNLLMVFDTMSSTFNPSIMYATHLTTDITGFEPALYLKKGLAATNNTRWGDYE